MVEEMITHGEQLALDKATVACAHQSFVPRLMAKVLALDTWESLCWKQERIPLRHICSP